MWSRVGDREGGRDFSIFQAIGIWWRIHSVVPHAWCNAIATKQKIGFLYVFMFVLGAHEHILYINKTALSLSLSISFSLNCVIWYFYHTNIATLRLCLLLAKFMIIFSYFRQHDRSFLVIIDDGWVEWLCDSAVRHCGVIIRRAHTRSGFRPKEALQSKSTL